MATHPRILAWKIPLTEEPGGLHMVHRVVKELDTTEHMAHTCGTPHRGPHGRSIQGTAQPSRWGIGRERTCGQVSSLEVKVGDVTKSQGVLLVCLNDTRSTLHGK